MSKRTEQPIIADEQIIELYWQRKVRSCGHNPGQGERKGLCTQGSKRKRHLQCMMQRNPSQRSFAGWDIRQNRRCTHG